ncbi:MAG TPA: DUF697 domain-containing protein, partial [Pirellulales bacterium]|nr:DUF697 domain-containing protein [Pirellulales bacterium]
NKHQTEVKKRLIGYMADFRLNEEDQRHALRQQGVSGEELEMMERTWLELKDENNRQDPAAWRASFETCFLGPLDRAADRTIREHAVLVAVKTTICPYSILDMAVVIYMGAAMLGSLCRSYKMSADPFSMLYLLGLVLGQAFFASQIEEHSQEAAGWLEEPIKGILGHSAEAIPDAVAGSVGKLAAKGGQGFANGLFLNRIGRHACRMLRPLPQT